MPRFIIEFSETVKDDMQWIDKNHHPNIKASILEQLQHQPNIETRNRKPLDPTIRDADWQLRCGEQNQFRVLYRFWIKENNQELEENKDTDILGTVLITAIGEKKNERLWIGGEELMKLIPLSRAKNTLSQVVLDAAEGPLIITKNGVAAAVVIVPENEDDLERLVLYRSKKLHELLNARVAAAKDGARLGFDEFWAEVEKG